MKSFAAPFLLPPPFCLPSVNKALELVDADPFLHHNAGIIFQVRMSSKVCSERTRQLQQQQTSEDNFTSLLP